MMQKAFDLFAPGRTIYLPGASGESALLADMLANDPGRAAGVHFISCPFPGINERDYAGLDPTATATVFMPPAAVRSTAETGRTRILPIAYSSILSYLAGPANIDVAIAHVAPPGPDGLCSLGIAADFSPVVWRNARQRVLLVNPSMPAMRHGPLLSLAHADVVVDADGPIVTVDTATDDAIADAVAQRVAALVPDDATIQIGLGNAPGAVWRHLKDHRNLVLGSGLVADGFRTLLDAGAMSEGADHRAGVILGSDEFIRFAHQSACIRMADVSETHNSERLARIERFTAINGALEVDLLGQINLEWQGGRLSSGVGGAPDFAAGAIRSQGGRSITALPSTARQGTISRIVPLLRSPPSLGRREADTIVTEHGVAELAGKSMDGRAEAMIAIAAPEHRSTLQAGWAAARAAMWNFK